MRLILRILSALILTVIASLVLVTFIPGQKWAELAGQQIEKQTGRQVVFGGDVRFSIWPTLGLRADNVALANADWAGPEPLLTAGRLVIGLDAAALIGGDVRITELSAIVPHIDLKTRADGRNSWTFAPQASTDGTEGAETAAQAETALPFVLEAFDVSGASFTYTAEGQAPVEMKNLDLSLLWPDPKGAATVNATLRPYGAPINVSAEVAQFARFITGGQSALTATLRAPQSRLTLEGEAGLDGTFEGTARGDSSDSQALLSALMGDGVAIPQGLGQAGEFSTDVTYSAEAGLSLRALKATLDGNAISGEAKIALTSPLNVNATLTAGVLDLSALDTGSDSGGAAAPGGSHQGWSTTPIDASALGLMEGTVAVQLAGLKTSTLTLGASAVSINVERARAVVSLSPARLFGGTVEGDLIANNRDGLSVAGDLSFSDIQLQQALGSLADYDKLTGAAQGKLQFLGVGNSTDAIMQGLSGKGDVEIGKGVFTGFDLQSIMDRHGGNGGTTVFNALSASYVIEGGELRNEDFAASLDAIKAAGAGRVGLSAQDLDYTFTPTAFASEGSTGVSVPVRVSGAWTDPKIRPDLSKLAEPELKALEAKVKAAAQEKLSNELDAPVETLEDTNEALKRRVEEEARKQLLQFLGGD